MDRRTFLGAGAAALSAQTAVPIVDTHFHLFDQTRPQGAPYSGGGSNRLPALPERYRRLATPLGIVAAIEIEASPWLEDNLWVLETIAAEPLVTGTIGNLQPEKPDFREFFDRFRKNRLFLGIRYGNLWGYDLTAQVNNAAFIEGMRLVAEAGLTLDTANPRADLMAAVVKLKDKVPGLRIVVDHTAHFAPGAAERAAELERNLRELAERPGMFFKVSQYLRTGPGGEAVTEARVYRPALDYLTDLFGEDRVLFGSDWPNADAADHLDAIVKIAREYFATKGRAAQEKYFWRNSLAAYRWVKRAANQPG